ncbi:hypothetical protein BD310DRAFT_234636 [Dichomitus squalens]|uniref:Uncharacterized protein n=1 Tax=Dichomitus squalens TaxID=114155 RepID=A0A4Q9Q1U7_9APHY|nr:hypothetical protein BD310DRAFT_234636 [Dichomitus squalens]
MAAGPLVRARMSAPAERLSMKTASTRATRARESGTLGKEMGMGESWWNDRLPNYSSG